MTSAVRESTTERRRYLKWYIPFVGGSSSLRRTHDKRNVIGERLGIARRLTDPHTTFAEISRRAEEQTGYSITVNALIKIEMGIRPTYDYEVAALALALGVDARFLLGLIDDPQRKASQQES